MSSKSLWNEVTCSLCVKYFIDPVTLGFGLSFCMPCLSLLEEGQWPPRCPVGRETPHQLNLKTNTNLRKPVLLARQDPIHRYTKNFLCKVTKDVYCLFCCMSEQQGAPRHGSLQWMAEEDQQKLLNIMRSVWEKIQENKRNLNRETNKIRTWHSYVSTWKKMKQTEYWKVFHLVYHEEKHHLEKTEEESKEIFQQLKESQYNMDLKQKLLGQIYEELKELCHKPDLELIQMPLFNILHFKGESAQLLLPRPVAPQLSAWPGPGLVGWPDQFQESTHHVPVFEDLRRVQTGPNGPEVDYTSPRSKYFLAWGAESFTSGQHYWEVDVAGYSDMVLDSEGIFLLLCIRENNQCSCFTASPLSPQYVRKTLGHVGVFLDYGGGVVSSVNVARSSLICSFLSCSFSSLLKPFLCSGYP
ncbi:hypothetical protein FD755_011274 [Muntiacus reevesi]|uniref:B30.2/SPRY domain-containing protein n=1 Tax=Muntiacus reevesi TaxID=9886 RepID=A0A5N3XS97_MUNRE|nr:hypothetical protein FD755_011274 [Muntiacus reevesi]